MIARAQTLVCLLLATALQSATAQELVVIAESPVFTLDTRFAAGSAFALVVTAESPGFTLDTRLSNGAALPALVVTTESPTFTLDTRLAGSNPALAALVVTAESATFVLDTRLAGKLEALIVEAVSPPFELNTMWLGLRRTARAIGSPVELYWPTNAPGFYPQSALPPLGPTAQWQDLTNDVSESGGLYRVLLSPPGSERYFRLKLPKP